MTRVDSAAAAAFEQRERTARQEAPSLDELAGVFARLKAALDELSRQDAAASNAQGAPSLDAQLDAAITTVLHEMRLVSLRAAARQSRNLDDLKIKAGIWMERAVPQDDDDTCRLAHSICRDILNLTKVE